MSDDPHSTATNSLLHRIDEYDDDDDDIVNLNLKTSRGFINPYNPLPTGGGHGPEAGDNDVDIYDYDNIITDGPVARTGTGAGDKDSERRVQTTSFDKGEGTTIYDTQSGAYDLMLDYATGDGGYHHRRERMTEDGIYQARDVQRRGDGSRHVHREYVNPVTGTRTVRDYEK
ncbi:hypothetical protein BJX76DRAFT_316608 [Aspergillus varians]